MFDRLEYYVEQLKVNPVGFLIYMCYYVFVILFSLILHECAHGWMALRCGDPTAKMLGRLSLNPVRHLDPLGTVCMFLLGFGWAKPVPVNPRNFENYRRDDFLVSIAGIAINLTIFIACVAVSVLLNPIILGDYHDVLSKVYINGPMSYVSPFYMDGYNVIQGNWAAIAAEIQETIGYFLFGNPIEGIGTVPADSWAFIKQYIALPELFYVQRLLLLMAQVNLTLALFNLLPIPPLDGFHLLNDTLLKGRLSMGGQAFKIMQVALIVIVLSGALDTVLSEGIMFVYEAVLKTFLKLTGQI